MKISNIKFKIVFTGFLRLSLKSCFQNKCYEWNRKYYGNYVGFPGKLSSNGVTWGFTDAASIFQNISVVQFP